MTFVDRFTLIRIRSKNQFMSAVSQTKSSGFDFLKEGKWKKTIDARKTDSFTADDLISAWESGMEKGAERERTYKSVALKANLSQFLQIAITLRERIISAGLGVNSLFVRAQSPIEFGSLIVVDHKSFSKENRTKLYQFARDLQKSDQSNELRFEFTFMDSDDSVNEEVIECDGYFFKYVGERNQA